MILMILHNEMVMPNTDELSQRCVFYCILSLELEYELIEMAHVAVVFFFDSSGHEPGKSKAND